MKHSLGVYTTQGFAKKVLIKMKKCLGSLIWNLLSSQSSGESSCSKTIGVLQTTLADSEW